MNAEFIDALDQLEKEKGISKEVLIEAIEAALISGYKRNFHSAQNVRVDVTGRPDRCVCLPAKPSWMKSSTPAWKFHWMRPREIDPNYQLDDIVEIEVTPADFGRIAAQTAKQVVTQRIREAERSAIYEEFVDREEDIVTGIVQRADNRYYYVDLGRVEALLPHNEVIAGERLSHGDRVKVYITRVEKSTKGPQIFLSRTHPGLLKRLFELEVPEIYDGVVEIKSIAREAGQRSKIAVASHNPDVDPVGACVGHTRIPRANGGQ